MNDNGIDNRWYSIKLWMKSNLRLDYITIFAIVSAIILVEVSILYYLNAPLQGNSFWVSLTLGVTTNTIGILIGVFVVDTLRERRRHKFLRSANKDIERDLKRFTSKGLFEVLEYLGISNQFRNISEEDMIDYIYNNLDEIAIYLQEKLRKNDRFRTFKEVQSLLDMNVNLVFDTLKNIYPTPNFALRKGFQSRSLYNKLSFQIEDFKKDFPLQEYENIFRSEQDKLDFDKITLELLKEGCHIFCTTYRQTNSGYKIYLDI